MIKGLNLKLYLISQIVYELVYWTFEMYYNSFMCMALSSEESVNSEYVAESSTNMILIIRLSNISQNIRSAMMLYISVDG